MPSYQVVPIVANLEALAVKIRQAKTRPLYDSQKDKWDQAVILILKTYCTLAENHRKTHADYVMERRNKCKKIIDDIETQLKKKVLISGEYSWIAGQPAVLAKLAKESNDDSRELSHANVHYRSGWDITAKECLSDKGKPMLKPFVDTREKGINQEDKVVIGYRMRCGEYVVRAQEFAKLAMQRSKKGAVDVDEFMKDAKEISEKMVAGQTKIADDRRKKHRLFTFFDECSKTKTWSDADKKQASVYFPQIQALAKETRGSFKTLTTLLNGLEARGKAAGPGWKDIAANAVKSAKADYERTKAAAESMTKEETACEKTLEKMKK